MWTQERLQNGELLRKAVPTDDNVADLMTKHLAAGRVEELLSKLRVPWCTRGLVVASLITTVEANHFDARADHVATVSFAHESCCWLWGAWFWLFVRRRLGSRLGGLALTEDAGAIVWIVEAYKEKSVHNDGRGAISGVRSRSTRLNDLV